MNKILCAAGAAIVFIVVVPVSEVGAQMRLESPAFRDGQPIPRRHSDEGENLSPPLAWSEVPSNAVELLLLVEDPDAAGVSPWVHWVVYRIAPRLSGLPEGVAPAFSIAGMRGAFQGKNSWGSIGYRGPLPPIGGGLHHYRFRLLALSGTVGSRTGLSADELRDGIRGKVIEESVLTGVYQR